MTKKTEYKGMTVEHHKHGWCWHDGTEDGDYGGYWPDFSGCKADIDLFLKHGRPF